MDLFIPRCLVCGMLVALNASVAGCDSPTDAGPPSWTSRKAGFGRTAITAIAYGKGRFVIVGDSGKLGTSETGEEWELRRTPFGQSNIRNVLFEAGQFVAIGGDEKLEGRTVATSPDGISWQAQRTANVSIMRGIGYGDGIWIIVGDGGVIQRSTDLLSWEEVGPPRDALWISATYADSMFVVSGGRESIAFSRDGTKGSWTVRTLGRPLQANCVLGPNCNDIDEVVFTGERVVAVTHPTGEVFTSRDLRTWTERSTGLSQDMAGLWVARQFKDISFVAGGNGKLALSRDGGRRWSPVDNNFEGTGIIGVGYGEGLYIIGGLEGRLSTSPLENWTH